MLAALEKFRDIGARRKAARTGPLRQNHAAPAPWPSPDEIGKPMHHRSGQCIGLVRPVDPYPAQSTIVLCANGLCGHVLVTLISASSATTSAPRATSRLISISSSVASTVNLSAMCAGHLRDPRDIDDRSAPEAVKQLCAAQRRSERLDLPGGERQQHAIATSGLQFDLDAAASTISIAPNIGLRRQIQQSNSMSKPTMRSISTPSTTTLASRPRPQQCRDTIGECRGILEPQDHAHHARSCAAYRSSAAWRQTARSARQLRRPRPPARVAHHTVGQTNSAGFAQPRLAVPFGELSWRALRRRQPCRSVRR